MGWDSKDVYYNPEHFGLEIVGTAEYGGGYDYDTFAVFKDAEGKFYYGEDQGCSCSSPFEGMTKADLTVAANRHELLNAIDSHASDGYHRDAKTAIELRSKVAAL
jgi:hypothetical protein